eukprot:6968028-Alexandrium_andersonii.AAC.1
MSASLVGSEMCIRDSHKAVPRARTRAAGQRHAWAPCFAHMGCVIDAVSYTHLTLPTICSV